MSARRSKGLTCAIAITAAVLSDGGSEPAGVDLLASSRPPPDIATPVLAGTATRVGLNHLVRLVAHDPTDSQYLAQLVQSAATLGAAQEVDGVLDALRRRWLLDIVSAAQGELALLRGDATAALSRMASLRTERPGSDWRAVAAAQARLRLVTSTSLGELVPLLGEVARLGQGLQPTLVAGQLLRASHVLALGSRHSARALLVDGRQGLPVSGDVGSKLLLTLDALGADDRELGPGNRDLIPKALNRAVQAGDHESAYASLARLSAGGLVDISGIDSHLCSLIPSINRVLRRECRSTRLIAAWDRGDLVAAIRLVRRLHEDLSNNAHPAVVVRFARVAIPTLKLIQGYAPAEALARQAAEIAYRLGDGRAGRHFEKELASLLRITDRYEEALDLLRSLIDRAGMEELPGLWLELSRTFRLAGDRVEARRAMVVAESSGAGPRVSDTVDLWLEQLAAGQLDDDGQVRSAFQGLLPEPFAELATRTSSGRIAELSGDLGKAHEHYAGAIAALKAGLATSRDPLVSVALLDTWRGLGVWAARSALEDGDVAAAFAALQAVRTPGDTGDEWTHLVRHLASDEIVLTLAAVDQVMWAFAVDDSGTRAQALDVSPESLESLAAMWRHALEGNSPSLVTMLGAKIAAHTLQPLEETGWLRRKRSVVLLLEGELQNVSFESLPASTGGTLGDKYVIARTRSVAVLDRAWHAPPPSGPPAVFVPVRSAQGRAEATSAVAGREGAIFMGSHATEEWFAVASKGARFVHYGGHSSAPAIPGAGGGLELRSSLAHDGLLDYAEIAGLDLLGSAVVLMGCDTARRVAFSNLATSDAPAGLADAFFSAGSRVVIGSLWAIDDSTASEFARLFYGNGGVEVGPVSLALARAEMRRRYPDEPRKWAAVVWEGVPRGLSEG